MRERTVFPPAVDWNLCGFFLRRVQHSQLIIGLWRYMCEERCARQIVCTVFINGDSWERSHVLLQQEKWAREKNLVECCPEAFFFFLWEGGFCNGRDLCAIASSLETAFITWKQQTKSAEQLLLFCRHTFFFYAKEKKNLCQEKVAIWPTIFIV